MQPRNYPLRIGMSLLLIILIIAIAGPAIAPHDPLQVYKSLVINGQNYGGPPLRAVPPFETMRFPLGVDRISRDMLSRLLWAVRPTLVLCIVVALVRVLLGLIIGVATGLVGRRLIWLLDLLAVVSGSIPLFLVAIGILIVWPAPPSVVAFTIAISLTGWINTATLVQAHVQSILHAPYLDSARAIGLRPWGIFVRYILPQVWPILPMVVAAELSAVTLVIAELGYFGFFIGGGFLYTDFVRDGPIPDIQVLTAGYPELGQMLSDFFGQYNRTPWVVLCAGCVIVVMLSSFTLLSEGFRRELDVTRPRTARWWRRSSGKQSAPRTRVRG